MRRRSSWGFDWIEVEVVGGKTRTFFFFYGFKKGRNVRNMYETEGGSYVKRVEEVLGVCWTYSLGDGRESPEWRLSETLTPGCQQSTYISSTCVTVLHTRYERLKLIETKI